MREKGQRIVLCCGAFDGVIHPGHMKFLKQAKACGDFLYVFISSDNDIKRYKHRVPLLSQEERIAHVAELAYVDKVFACGDDNVQNASQMIALKPDIYCFGGDQVGNWADQFARQLETHGIEVVCLQREDDTYSTSKMIEAMHKDISNSIHSIIFSFDVLTQKESHEEIKGLVKKLSRYYSILLISQGPEREHILWLEQEELVHIFAAIFFSQNNKDISVYTEVQGYLSAEEGKNAVYVCLATDKALGNIDTIMFTNYHQLLDELHTRKLLM